MLTMTTGTESLDTGSQLVSGSYITIFLVRVLDVPMRVLYPIITYIENIFTLISQAGVQTLVYLTALQSISPSMYEVAKMEGATAYETFWKVTIPSIMHITLFVIVYTIYRFAGGGGGICFRIQAEQNRYQLGALGGLYFQRADCAWACNATFEEGGEEK